MAFHNELIIPPYLVQFDVENLIGFLALIGLLVFFRFAFERVLDTSNEKPGENRLSYSNSTAA